MLILCVLAIAMGLLWLGTFKENLPLTIVVSIAITIGMFFMVEIMVTQTVGDLAEMLGLLR